jgi:hypothetical protein
MENISYQIVKEADSRSNIEFIQGCWLVAD